MAPANLCLLFCLVCELVSGGEFYEDNDGVLLLDNTNFDLAVEAHELLLVKFYAPWCGHCKKFAPVFADIATKLRAVQSAALPQSQAQVRLGKLDGTESVSIAERFEVKGYPKLKLFRNGRPEPYNGKRTADDVLGYLQKFQRAAVKEMKSVEEAVEFAGHSDAALLGFFDKLEGLEWDNFQKAGKVHDEVRFAVTTSHKIISHFKVEETPTALLFKTFGEGEEKLEKLTGKAIGDPRRLNRFVVANSMPTVIDFSVKDMRKFLGPGRVRFFGVQLMMFLDPTSPDFEQQRHALQYVADKNKERMIHVLISPNHAKVCKFFEIDPTDPKAFPAAAILRVNEQDPEKSIRYNFEVGVTRRFDAAGLLGFTDDFFNGLLRPQLKSAEPPAEQGVVKVVVGKTFESLIMLDDKRSEYYGKDVLLEFYSPKCEYCKELAPEYWQLATELAAAKVKSVVVAKIDATENEVMHDKIEVSSFPAVFLFRAFDRANPVRFDGSRDRDALFHFVSHTAAVTFTYKGEGHGAGVADQQQDDTM